MRPLIVFAACLAQAQPPQILDVSREFFKPGTEKEMFRIESAAASVCREMKCPHPYLGMETVDGPKQVWYINGFTSKEDLERVRDAYNRRPDLLARLNQFVQQRTDFTSQPSELFPEYRPDLSRGPQWNIGFGRFLVVTVTKDPPRSEGSVYETADGLRFVITSAKARKEADAKRAAAGPDAKILAIRQSFSMPASEWVAADPSFWNHK